MTKEMTTKTLFIHIGHYKTGTTALQVFFAHNRRSLATLCFDYAAIELHNAKHSAFAFSLLHAVGIKELMHGYSNPVRPEQLWQDLFDYVRRSVSPNVLISSEEFMRFGAFPDAAAKLKEVVAANGADVDVKVIAYLRSPQSHLKSWYNQLIKMGIVVPDYFTALQGKIEIVHVDYHKALAPWVDLVGTDNVILRQYDPLRGDPHFLHRDFVSIFGQELPETLDYPKGNPNPRLDDRLLEMIRLMQNNGSHPKAIENLCKEAGKYFANIDATAPAQVSALNFVRDESAAGIASLSSFSNSNLDLEEMAADLPCAQPNENGTEAQLLAFIYSELLALRRRVNRMELGDTNGWPANRESKLKTSP